MYRIIGIFLALLLPGCGTSGGYDLRTGWFYGPARSAYDEGVIRGQLEVRQRAADEVRENAYRKAELCRQSRHIGPGGWFSGSSDCIPSNMAERAILEQAIRDGDARAAAERNYARQRAWDNEVERGRSSVPVR